MAAARLSPAAHLLRNSRLFAIPTAVCLPSVEPSSEPISYSDSATTPYPTRAAIETSLSSLNQGDWGLKRPLPTKTTLKSGTPLVRFQRGIDTPEHVVDFESAADHVLTLRKYQELNLRVTLPAPRTNRGLRERTSPFEAELDHTTDQPAPVLNQHTSVSWLDEDPSERAKRMPEHLKDALQQIEKERDRFGPQSTRPQAMTSIPIQPEQTSRRWRYSGPYLAGLNGLEFDAFLKSITREKRVAFREVVKNDLMEKRAHEQRLRALEEGQTVVPSQLPAEITEQDILEHMRYLRSEPGKFGPLITKFFDLADGPKPSPDTTDPWSYGRDTIAADLYRESGPPRTHPSAGLSYAKTELSVRNDPIRGPRAERVSVAGRLLKSIPSAHQKHKPFVGVAGFVVPQPEGRNMASDQNWKWEPVTDGKKLVVTPNTASVTQAGKLEIQTKLPEDWAVDNDQAIYLTEKRTPAPKERTATSTYRMPSSQVPDLTQHQRRRSQSAPQPNQDIDRELEALYPVFTKSMNRNAR